MLDLLAIDPRTVFVIAALMIVLNGAVLGLMHSSLAPDAQPSAFSWRVGTLLQAAGCVLLAVQAFLPPGFVLPLANACILFGCTGYLRAVRQFNGLPERWQLLLPGALATVGVYWFAAVTPSLDLRIVIVSLAMAVILFTGAYTLHRSARSEPMASRAVLTGIFLVIGAVMLARALYSSLASTPAPNLLQTTYWPLTLAPLLSASLPVIGTTAFVLMCTERLRSQWELAASTDYLTGLANRLTLAAEGKRIFHAARRQDGALVVAILDIDHFKNINDRHGHDVGDLALKHLATLLETACRDSDLPGRLGGEEFCLIYDQATPDHGLDAAERFRQQLQSQPLLLDQMTIQLTVSIGVAALQPGDRSFEDLLRRADQALYSAKAGGRNRVVFAELGKAENATLS